MLVANAVCRDQQVDGLAHRVTALPEVAVMGCRFDGECRVVRIDDLELEQFGLNGCSFAIVAKPAQYLGENQRGQPDALAVEMQVEPLALWIADAVEEIDPDGRVDDDQALSR